MQFRAVYIHSVFLWTAIGFVVATSVAALVTSYGAMLGGRVYSSLTALHQGIRMGNLSMMSGMISRKSSTNASPSKDLVTILRTAQAYCFDVDSTVITEEGIDTLAEYKGVGKQVAEMTAQ